METLLSNLTPTMIFPVITIALLLWFFIAYWRALAGPRPRRGTLEWIAVRAEREAHPRRLAFPAKCHPMARRDALPVLIITALYALTAFWNLGSFTNPQTWCDFGDGESREIVLSQPVEITGLMYYPMLGTGSYRLEVSEDGSEWLALSSCEDEEGEAHYRWVPAGEDSGYHLSQDYTTLFKWLEVTPEESVTVRCLRITGQANKDVLQLGELALKDTAGEWVNDGGAYAQGGEDALLIWDEYYVIPDAPSWYNSSYFDEIYHPRTALEHIEGIEPYEISHPPMGKLIMGLGIRMFGMTPFGWRFMGTLFGVAMLPLLYVFLKNLFGRTAVAACGTTLFAADFMHLTQTRIATIDTYGVFFILLMYYFLYRWLTQPAGTPFRKGALPLFLSGLFWGIGAASKWTVIYGGLGLAVLYFIGLFFKLRDWPAGSPEEAPQRPGPWVGKILLFSVLCFILIPAVIYTLAYLPYAQADGDVSLGNLISVMWENQKYMLTYHNGVHDPHPYSSRWYQWILDIRPILYYLDWQSVPGMKSAFGAFVNPVVCWGGLLALVTAVVQIFRRRCGIALFIVIGYFSQLAPWFAIGRTTFAYHYFPSVLFLVLALSYVFHTLLETSAPRRRGMMYGVTAGAVGLYVLFYPVLTGVMVPTWYGLNLLKWMPSWPF